MKAMTERPPTFTPVRQSPHATGLRSMIFISNSKTITAPTPIAIHRRYLFLASGSASAAVISNLPSGSSYYYDYAPDVVYVNGEEIGTVDEFTEQAQQLADAGAQSIQQADTSQTADSMEWMSLGVFALALEQKGDTNMLLQLAVAKDGTIAGTYHNRLIEQTLPVQGSVDRNTQRAAWTIGDKQNTVFETGIYNLTREQMSVLVHFGKDRTETWLMVRIDEPQGQQ